MNRNFPSCIAEDAFEWVGDHNKTPHSLPDVTSSNTRYTCEDFPEVFHCPAVYAVYAISSLDTSSPLRHRTRQRRRDTPGSCRARSPALHVGRRDRVASYGHGHRTRMLICMHIWGSSLHLPPHRRSSIIVMRMHSRSSSRDAAASTSGGEGGRRLAHERAPVRRRRCSPSAIGLPLLLCCLHRRCRREATRPRAHLSACLLVAQHTGIGLEACTQPQWAGTQGRVLPGRVRCRKSCPTPC